MGKLGIVLRALALVVSTLYLLSLAALALRQLVDPNYIDAGALDLLQTLPGQIALGISAAMSVLIAIYFLARLWDVLNRNQRFVREGGQGPIEVSSFAIEDFIRGVLAKERDLKTNRIVLSHAADDALDVGLNITFQLDAPVVDLAERLQYQIKQEIEHRLGIEVNKVTVYAKRMDGKSTTTSATTSQPATPQVQGGADGPGETDHLSQSEDDREDDEHAV